jgi:Undecaprenyl-phosphate galactose phosphotransferase WbaP
MDLAVTLSAGICILPLVGMIAAIIKLTSAGPIFYSQERLGRNGRKFRAWKFRSMVSNADQVLKVYLAKHPELREEWERDYKLKNDPRITRIGRFIRKTSLDELPQIWNVICGDMSLVGPRPIVQAEIAKYKETYRQYTRVTPGISGLWQVSGRNNTTYDERLAYDRYYVENWSPWMDLYILSRTIRVVLLREGAY